VLVMGTDLTDLPLNDQAGPRRRLIGYVFQDFNLLAGFTAIENVTVPLELDGTSAKAAHATGMKALALSRVPALDLAITVIGVPVAAALAGWLLAERRPPVSRQALA
jgi:ABC-type polar amino acid transport system ATPase subunit